MRVLSEEKVNATTLVTLEDHRGCASCVCKFHKSNVPSEAHAPNHRASAEKATRRKLRLSEFSSSPAAPPWPASQRTILDFPDTTANRLPPLATATVEIFGNGNTNWFVIRRLAVSTSSRVPFVSVSNSKRQSGDAPPSGDSN